MKKTIKLTMLVLLVSTVFLACKDTKSEETKNETQSEEHMAADKADMAMNDIYQCPMDCEEGKTYDEAGTCPICAMDLKKLEGKHADDNGEEHEDHEEEHDEHEDND